MFQLLIKYCTIKKVMIMDKRSDAIETVVDVFNEAMSIQELYLRKSKFKELSMSETHVIDAVDKAEFPSMTNVAKILNVTMGTLTTAVKKIIEKGFLIKERSNKDQRVYYLKLTKKGHEALEIHEQFHRELAALYKAAIPDDRVDWVFDTLKKIKIDLDNYKQALENKK